MKKVLIIEDDKSIALLEKDYLEINEFEVVIENKGNEKNVLELIKDVNLIILDLMLPENDGFYLCKLIRSKYEIPIIIISAKDSDFDKVRGLGLGADDYMTKPFSPNELIARVKANINRYERLTSMNKSDTIEVKGMIIDKIRKKVIINSNEIVLTPKEYQILLLLFENRGRIFSKEDIFDKIWKEESYGDINTISVHIRRIREKLERDPSNPEYIETIWGVGYRGN